MTDTLIPSLAPITGGGSVPTWSVADRLRKAREHAGLDQTKLALFTALSRATISAAENGRTHLRGTSLRLWAISTGVSLEWLETGEAPSDDADGASESVARPEGFEPPTFCSGAAPAPQDAPEPVLSPVVPMVVLGGLLRAALVEVGAR